VTQPSELGGPARRVRRARGSITAADILRGSFSFVEAQSVDALTMPRLAQHLDVGVTSIYWYYKSKEDLLDAMTTASLAWFYDLLPEFPDRPWDQHLLLFFREFRRIFREKPVLCDLVIMRNGNFTSESVSSTWDRIEGLIRALVTAGFDTETATQAYFMLSVYTRGCLIVERMIDGPPSVLMPPPLPSRESLDADFEFGLLNAVTGLSAKLELIGQLRT
jgi:AcrR family transcriptional regulator